MAMMIMIQPRPPPSVATTHELRQAKMMTPVLWYQSPKNLSSSWPSRYVWWSSSVPSSSSLFSEPGMPKRGAQPTRSQRASSSTSGAWPLAEGEAGGSTAPALEGAGRSYLVAPAAPSSASETRAVALWLRSWWKPGGTRARAWARFSSGLASGSNWKAALPPWRAWSTTLCSSASAVTRELGSWAATRAPCCFSSEAFWAVPFMIASVRGRGPARVQRRQRGQRGHAGRAQGEGLAVEGRGAGVRCGAPWWLDYVGCEAAPNLLAFRLDGRSYHLSSRTRPAATHLSGWRTAQGPIKNAR